MITFQANESKDIEVQLPAQNSKRIQDKVFVYINDLVSDRIQENLTFNITYAGPFP